MHISNKYIGVKKKEEEVKEGFQEVKVEDSFVYSGVIEYLPEMPVFIQDRRLAKGDTVIFAKYSPDTQTIKHEGQELKFVRIEDLLAVL